MDKNKDGFLSKGEIKLASKDIKMKDVDAIMGSMDLNKDGKLGYSEFEQLKNMSDKKKKTKWKYYILF